MKRALILVATLLLAGCAETEPVAQKGEVISCASVTSDSSVRVELSLSVLMVLKAVPLNPCAGP